jgi:hypothetical protein
MCLYDISNIFWNVSKVIVLFAPFNSEKEIIGYIVTIYIMDYILF